MKQREGNVHLKLSTWELQLERVPLAQWPPEKLRTQRPRVEKRREWGLEHYYVEPI